MSSYRISSPQGRRWRQSNPRNEICILRIQCFCSLNGSFPYGQSKNCSANWAEQLAMNDLVVARPDGSPCRRDRVSADFSQMLRRSGMAHIRFHDLRHTAATNMHQLTGDFYTVGKIFGHSIKGIGIQLGSSTNLEATTTQYVDVRLDRIRVILQTYHNEILPEKQLDIKREHTHRKDELVK